MSLLALVSMAAGLFVGQLPHTAHLCSRQLHSSDVEPTPVHVMVRSLPEAKDTLAGVNTVRRELCASLQHLS